MIPIVFLVVQQVAISWFHLSSPPPTLAHQDSLWKCFPRRFSVEEKSFTFAVRLLKWKDIRETVGRENKFWNLQTVLRD